MTNTLMTATVQWSSK